MYNEPLFFILVLLVRRLMPITLNEKCDSCVDVLLFTEYWMYVCVRQRQWQSYSDSSIRVQKLLLCTAKVSIL